MTGKDENTWYQNAYFFDFILRLSKETHDLDFKAYLEFFFFFITQMYVFLCIKQGISFQVAFTHTINDI